MKAGLGAVEKPRQWLVLGVPAEAGLLASPQGEGGAEVTQKEGGGEKKVQEAL